MEEDLGSQRKAFRLEKAGMREPPKVRERGVGGVFKKDPSG